MTTTSSNTFDAKLSGSVSQSGFRPRLSTVAGGSYASNPGHGSAAPTNDTYPTQGVAGSKCSIRRQDKSLDFECSMLLDTSGAAPAFTAGDELRVRVRSLSMGEPARYSNGLPPPSKSSGLPLASDVEVVDPSTGAAPAGFPSVAGVGQLQARVLQNGDLAFVVADLSAGPPSTVTPLTVADLTPLFGAVDSVVISVRGSYRV